MNTPVDLLRTNQDMVGGEQVEGGDILQLLLLLWSKKIWIFLSALIFGIFGLANAYTKVPQYRADALVQLETRSSALQFSEDITEMLTPESKASTEIEILKSRLVLGKVVEALSLDVVATPRELPKAGNFLSRVEIPRPDLASLKRFCMAWGEDRG